MDWKLELVIVPVSDVDRAKTFYVDQLGFVLDVDYQPNPQFRVVQVTPPGSACSISFGVGLGSSTPGSLQGVQLIVTDIEAAREHLVKAGADTGELFHFADGQQKPGADPKHADYNSFVTFKDPDGNGWTVQEVPSRARATPAG